MTKDQTEAVVKLCSGCRRRTQEALATGGESRPQEDGWRLRRVSVAEKSGQFWAKKLDVNVVRLNKKTCKRGYFEAVNQPVCQEHPTDELLRLKQKKRNFVREIQRRATWKKLFWNWDPNPEPWK